MVIIMENYTPEPITEESETTAPVSAPIPGQNDPVVGTGAFFGLEFLFALPLIGFLCTIIFSLAPKNSNLKHYARAKLIWASIGLVLSFIIVLVTVLLLQALPDMVSKELGVPVEDIEDIISIAEDIPGLVEKFGGISEIVDNVGNIANIAGQIGEIENIEEIVSRLGEIEDVDALISELESMENIDEIIAEIENIENVEALAEQIDNPEVIDALLEAYKNYTE